MGEMPQTLSPKIAKIRWKDKENRPGSALGYQSPIRGEKL